MTRIFAMIAAGALALSACTPVAGVPGGTTAGGGYRISSSDESRVQVRMLDAVNALRADAGLSPVELDSRLTAAAATHSRDMSVQNRPWHFGSDGSSPVTRIQRAGYNGRLLGENISESYETELQTLSAWMKETPTRETIMAPSARDMGFSWHQEGNGKLWWTLMMGAPGGGAPVIASGGGTMDLAGL